MRLARTHALKRDIQTAAIFYPRPSVFFIRGQRSAAGLPGVRRKFASHRASSEPRDAVNPLHGETCPCYGVPPTSS
jgi:hypothetical protein